MNAEQRAALRRLAEEATQGERIITREGFSTVYVEARIGGGMLQEIAAFGPCHGGQVEQVANADLCAAANPSTILQLLDYIEKLEKDAARYRVVFDDDLAAMKEPLFNARTGEELPEVRWTIWWNGPNKTFIRDAIDAAMQEKRNEHSD